jgi:hypothetical protein
MLTMQTTTPANETTAMTYFRVKLLFPFLFGHVGEMRRSFF